MVSLSNIFVYYFYHKSLINLLAFLDVVVGQAYIGGAYDFGQARYGERRGDLGPAAIAGITIGAVAVAAALIVTVYFCYYARNHSDDSIGGNTKYHMANGP